MNLRPFRAGLVIAIAILFAASARAAQWRVPRDFPTTQAAIDSPVVGDGDTILVGPGNFAGALITKSVHIEGVGRAVSRLRLRSAVSSRNSDSGVVTRMCGGRRIIAARSEAVVSPVRTAAVSRGASIPDASASWRMPRRGSARFL